jgi:hypothetical protein
MVVMLEDGAEAEHARSALQAARFPDRDLVLYPAQQILRAHEAFLARRRLPQKLVGPADELVAQPDLGSVAVG